MTEQLRNVDAEYAAATADLDESADASDMVALYLRQIGKISLLNAEQEVDLARRMEAGALANERLLADEEHQLYIKQVAHEAYDDDELQLRADLTQLVLDGHRAKRQLVEANLRLVVSIAKTKKHKTEHLSLLDLIQEGNLGLAHAADMFNFAKGYKFSTYATAWIHQSIDRGISGTAARGSGERLIRLPVSDHEDVGKLKRIETAYFQDNGCKPTVEWLAKELNKTPEKVLELQDIGASIVSLNKKTEQGDTELGNFVGDRAPGTAERAIANIMGEHTAAMIQRCLAVLEPEERLVAEMIYGFAGKPYKVPEIAEELGWDSKEILRFKRQAMRKMIVFAQDNGLRELLD